MSEIKSEKVIILGPSGSGKDFLMRKLIEKGLKGCLKWTTRPKRKLEQQGITYNFVESTEFIKSVNENMFLTYQKFKVDDLNTWYYGITNDEFENSQVFIMTPFELKDIPINKRNECFVVYLDINREIRENRLNIRKDTNDSIKRRLDSDDIDFRSFKDYDLRITDPEFDVDCIYDLMT
jgi:guanylate kinase